MHQLKTNSCPQEFAMLLEAAQVSAIGLLLPWYLHLHRTPQCSSFAERSRLLLRSYSDQTSVPIDKFAISQQHAPPVHSQLGWSSEPLVMTATRGVEVLLVWIARQMLVDEPTQCFPGLLVLHSVLRWALQVFHGHCLGGCLPLLRNCESMPFFICSHSRTSCQSLFIGGQHTARMYYLISKNLLEFSCLFTQLPLCISSYRYSISSSDKETKRRYGIKQVGQTFFSHLLYHMCGSDRKALKTLTARKQQWIMSNRSATSGYAVTWWTPHWPVLGLQVHRGSTDTERSLPARLPSVIRAS